jgi:hypothetical protein
MQSAIGLCATAPSRSGFAWGTLFTFVHHSADRKNSLVDGLIIIDKYLGYGRCSSRMELASYFLAAWCLFCRCLRNCRERMPLRKRTFLLLYRYAMRSVVPSSFLIHHEAMYRYILHWNWDGLFQLLPYWGMLSVLRSVFRHRWDGAAADQKRRHSVCSTPLMSPSCEQLLK